MDMVESRPFRDGQSGGVVFLLGWANDSPMVGK